MSEKRKNSKKKNDPQDLARFIEEFSWLLRSFDDVDLSALSNLAHQIQVQSLEAKRLKELSTNEDTVRTLVGFLPSFFTNLTLFPTNEDIVEFAHAALGLPLTRWQKKSKYEIIGQIVCHTNEASLEKIQRLSGLIDEMRDEKTSVRKGIEMDRSLGQSWSEVIARLYNNE